MNSNVNWDASALLYIAFADMRFNEAGIWQNTSKVKTGGNIKTRFFAQ